MPVKIKQIIKRAVFFVLCTAILIAAPVAIVAENTKKNKKIENFAFITIWQVDCFEGGKGSRASYLQNLGNRFKAAGGCPVNVVSLPPSAVLPNIEAGAAPDLISFGAGMCGIENLLSPDVPYTVWARGGYCLLAVDENADFSDADAQNTVINLGTGNLSSAAALLCGLDGAACKLPTEAYVDLINGGSKYLLGTQRDIFRLKTRGANFKVKAVSEFNDLYQNISVITKNPQNIAYCKNFIEFVMKNSSELSKIGLIGDIKLYDDEMAALEGVECEVKLISPLSQSRKSEIERAIENSDIKKLKNLLK